MKAITSIENIIKSDDIIERIAELKELDDKTEEERNELLLLENLVVQTQDYGECLLISKDYFIAKVLCVDIRDTINWEGVVEDLKEDYTEVDFEGVTYLIIG